MMNIFGLILILQCLNYHVNTNNSNKTSIDDVHTLYTQIKPPSALPTITISRSTSNNTKPLTTPLTPLEYSDKLYYTPPSLRHFGHIDHGAISHNNSAHHSTERSMTLPSPLSMDTMKVRLSINENKVPLYFGSYVQYKSRFNNNGYTE